MLPLSYSMDVAWPMLKAFFGLQKPLKLPRCHALWCPDARWAALLPCPPPQLQHQHWTQLWHSKGSRTGNFFGGYHSAMGPRWVDPR